MDYVAIITRTPTAISGSASRFPRLHHGGLDARHSQGPGPRGADRTHRGHPRGGGTCARTIHPRQGDKRPAVSGRCRDSCLHQRASVGQLRLAVGQSAVELRQSYLSGLHWRRAVSRTGNNGIGCRSHRQDPAMAALILLQELALSEARSSSDGEA
jgi:hypothetical protein